MKEFRQELVWLIGRSEEIADDIPDEALADYLVDCVAAYERLHNARALYVEESDDPPAVSTYHREHKLWRVTDESEQSIGRCNKCGDEMRWHQCRTRSGVRNMPLDKGLEKEIEGELLAPLHFAVCRVAKEEEAAARAEALGDSDDTPF